MEKMQSSKDYFHEVLEPNRSDFERDTRSLRFMTNYVISLFHLADWLWHSESDRKLVISEWGNPNIKDEKALWKCVEKKVANAGYIRDVANAVKHMKLEHKPSTPTVRHASQVESRPGDFDAGDFSGRDFYTAEIVVDGMPLFPVCEAVYDFWKVLINKIPNGAE